MRLPGGGVVGIGQLIKHCVSWILPGKHSDMAELVLLADGVEYARPGSPPICIKWADVQAIDYEWGPWYDDLWGAFPFCQWCFKTNDHNCLRIEDSELAGKIMLPAMVANFSGFVGEHEVLKKMAWETEFADGNFRCWTSHSLSG